MQKSSFSLLIFLLGATSIFSQKALTMKGLVVDGELNEALIGAMVVLQDSDDGRTSTDFGGSFKINTTKGLPWHITISHIGYHDKNIKVESLKEIPIIKMEENPDEINKIIICPLPPPIKIDTRIINGRVIDKLNQTPLIASTIKIEGTKLSTVTDLEGYFELEIPTHLSVEKIIFNYTGYETQQFHLKHFTNDLVIEMDQGVIDCRVLILPETKKKKGLRRFFKRKKSKG